MENQQERLIRGYELHERIGEGGFGAVHRAYQPIVQREVAIKVILPEYANNPHFVRNFEAEARLIAHLEHPFIVPLFDYWREPDGAYLVMRYFPAGSLRNLLKQQGAIPADKAAEMLSQIAGALDTAHRRGVIHYDIKPENILMDDQGNAFIADFGIAKKVDQDDSPPEDKKQKKQKEEGFSGTVGYAAPELLRRERGSHLSDIYSLGFVAYEMLTGKHAFFEQTPVMMLMSHMERELPRIDGVSNAVMAALWKATAKAPEDRYQSARAFAIDFQQGLSQQKATPAPVQVTVPEEIINPYKGLRPFDETDAGDFFGRDALVTQILDQLDSEKRWNGFLAVVGPSGSGKSSVVHAGLLPALRAGKLPHSDQWFILNMTPGTRPLQQLKTVLLSIAIDPMDTLSGKLQSGSRGLIQALDEVLHGKQDLFLVIDQFEELFTLVEDEQERQHFLDLLYTAATTPGSRLHTVITLRADFYDKPLLYENFGALVQARTQVVLPLSMKELEQAITGPAKRAGLEYDADLVAAIIADVRQEPGALPLLQHALTEVFEHREGNRLTLAAYQKSGRILGALAGRAEDVYNSLNPEQQAIAQQIFLRLVAPGDGTEDTRRRARYSELAALKISRETLQLILDAFGKYRLLTFDRDSETREPTIELAHEALIRGWNRLRSWLDQNRSDIRLQRVLAVAADDWHNAHHDKSYLLSGTRLAQFQEWAKTSRLALSQEEQNFLEASIDENQRAQALEIERQRHELQLERRSRQRLQIILGILILASIAGISLTVLLYQQSQAAQQESANAKREAAVANSLRLSTLAEQANSQGDTIKALSYGLQATSIDNPPMETLDTLINIAYAPGLRRIVQADKGRSITALAVSPDGRYALSGTGLTSNVFGLSAGPGSPPPPGGQAPPPPSVGGPPDGGAPPDGQAGQATLPPLDESFSQSNAQAAAPQDTLTLWDMTTAQEVNRLQTDSTPFSDIIFVPQPPRSDQVQAITATQDGTIILWDVLNGKPIAQFTVPSAQKITLSLTQDGHVLLVVGGENDNSTAHPFQILWDVQTHQVIRQVDPQAQDLWTGRITPDGKMVVASYNSGMQVTWDVTTGKEIHRFTNVYTSLIKGPLYGLQLGSDGTTGTVGVLNFGEPQVMLLNLTSGEVLKTFLAPTVTTAAAMLTRDGSQLLIMSQDGELRLWDVSKSTEIETLLIRNATFTSLGFGADGHYAVTGSNDGSLYFWDIAGTPVREIRRFNTNATTGVEVKQVAFLGDGSKILTFATTGVSSSGGTSHLTIWNVQTGQPLSTFGQGHIYMPAAMAVSPDGKYALTGTVANVPGVPRLPGKDDSIILWDIEAGIDIRHFDTPNDIFSLAFDPLSGKDGRPYRAAMPQGNDVGLWNVNSGQLIRAYKGHTGSIGGLAFSPDGRFLASTGRDGAVIIWDVETGTVVHTFKLNGGSNFITFSPDGKSVATGSGQADVALWDIATGTKLKTFTGHENGVNSFAFSADGKRALSGSRDNTVIMWDVSSGQIIHRYTEPTTSVWQAVFSPDQKSFVSGSSSLILWRADPIGLDEVKTWVSANRYLPTSSGAANATN